MINSKNVNIEQYRKYLKKILRQLGQWRFLTIQEQLEWEKTTDSNRLDNLVTISRHRMMKHDAEKENYK